MKPTMHVTAEPAGEGAFCNACQSKGNNWRRLVGHTYCVKVQVTNYDDQDKPNTGEIFLCLECIPEAKKEAEKNGEYACIVEEGVPAPSTWTN